MPFFWRNSLHGTVDRALLWGIFAESNAVALLAGSTFGAGSIDPEVAVAWVLANGAICYYLIRRRMKRITTNMLAYDRLQAIILRPLQDVTPAVRDKERWVYDQMEARWNAVRNGYRVYMSNWNPPHSADLYSTCHFIRDEWLTLQGTNFCGGQQQLETLFDAAEYLLDLRNNLWAHQTTASYLTVKQVEQAFVHAWRLVDVLERRPRCQGSGLIAALRRVYRWLRRSLGLGFNELHRYTHAKQRLVSLREQWLYEMKMNALTDPALATAVENHKEWVIAHPALRFGTIDRGGL